MKFLLAIFIILFLALFGVNFGFANEENSHESEIQEGKELVEIKESCDKLTDEQLEAVGDYLMEQMHPGESHEAIHQMMGMEEGTEYHKVFHINLAKTMYCGQNGMPMTQMMPMMQTMMSRTGSDGSNSNWWQGTGLWLTTFLYVIWLVVGVLAAIWLWKQIIRKK